MPIPVHKLQDKTDLGFELKAFHADDDKHKKFDDSIAHRDDHYIFFLITKGKGSMIVDFEEKTVGANQLYYILPEQIHYRIRTSKANGWFVAVYPSLIDADCRHVFESWSGFREPVTLSQPDISDYNSLLNVLLRKTKDEQRDELNIKMLHSLLNAFLKMAADTIGVASNIDVKNSRPIELSEKFKKLLTEHIKSCKRPSQYAEMLHVSESYLNECVKKTTGSPVSFWIQYKIITEAKRLLYFSDMTVKQIAAHLGFENYSYFSRFFAKETEMTALAFRKKARRW